jgi:hypothetical protein
MLPYKEEKYLTKLAWLGRGCLRQQETSAQEWNMYRQWDLSERHCLHWVALLWFHLFGAESVTGTVGAVLWSEVLAANSRRQLKQKGIQLEKGGMSAGSQRAGIQALGSSRSEGWVRYVILEEGGVSHQALTSTQHV